MAKIFVTGSQGFLGCTLVPYLRSCGHEVIAHSRNYEVAGGGDLRDPTQVRTVLEASPPDVIINLAALANVDECERNPQLAYLANVRIVENLAKWIRGTNNKCHLVQISTDQLYDNAGLHEESDITLTNYYGFSKYAGELAAVTVPSTVLRTNFFGPSRCSGRKSLSDWLVQSLNAGSPITVFDDVCFSPLSLQRLVEVIELVAVKKIDGIFNLGSREGMSKAEFAFRLADVMGLPIGSIRRGSSDEVSLSAYRPKNMCMNVARFEKTFEVDLPTCAEEIQSMKVVYDEAR
jgi:dTDP-4-dehydrorhamnose reductase